MLEKIIIKKIISIKSTWKCYWEWTEQSNILKLQNITPINYQLSSSKKIENQNLFSDCTESIFEGVKDFKISSTEDLTTGPQE